MRRGFRLGALACAAMLGAVGALAVAQPASADSATCSKRVLNADGTTRFQGCAGMAFFMSYGDHLMVDDRLGDGYAAVVQWWRSDGTGPYEVWNRLGADGGDVVAETGDIPEGDWIFYKVCIGSGGVIQRATCSDGVTDYA
ncbi:hypothetical protein [Allorhizocola rhizosphaerae]|uniref:hypothetical protein n=1 Tax=Allorhizocola rhizosphaerae TaxID=1872709 RepID=UPI000E3E8763|nr:hypothetical protein [Allorhizocola rhizosphaerae]